VRRLLTHLDGVDRLFLTLLYGTGLRLSEGLRLRVKDVDFSLAQITVRDGKGAKDRMTMLPDSLKAPLTVHLQEVRELHRKDLAEGFARAHSSADCRH
jgi:site-specific recombinase XerD